MNRLVERDRLAKGLYAGVEMPQICPMSCRQDESANAVVAHSMLKRTTLICWVVFLTAGAPGLAKADFKTGYAAFEARDYATALAELLPLADQGDAASQRLLGVIFRNGLLGAPDSVGAARWFRAAAEQGDADALYSLGVMYYEGETGLPDGDTEPSRLRGVAVELFEAAANRNHVDAQLYLGHAYAEGIGVALDREVAFMWFQLAAWQRESLAVAARDRLAADMSATEIADAKAMARAWQPFSEDE